MVKLYLLLSCVLLFSCTPKPLSIADLQLYVLDESNGLRKSVDIDGSNACVTYRPTDFWVYQELDKDLAEHHLVDSLRKKYSEYYYFIVSLSANNKEALQVGNNLAEYGDLVQTMSFRLPQYVHLITEKNDTIPVGDFMLNRTYGLSSSTDVLFAFDKERVSGNNWFQFNLNEFGLGFGNLKFKFSTHDLENIPEVDFNKPLKVL